MKKNEFNLLTYRPAKASRSVEILSVKSKINWSLVLKGSFVGSLGLVMLYMAIQENLFVPELLLGMTIVFMLLMLKTSCRQSFSKHLNQNH